ncbi:TPA: glycosyltransferase [Vibrio diabolicus]
MLSIDVLISTLNNGIEQIYDNEPPVVEGVQYIIIHQTSVAYELSSKIHKLLENRSDIKYHHIDTLGLSNSRNAALARASSDLVVFCDDDVYFLTDAFDKIRSVFDIDEEIDIATFKVVTPEGEPFKNYQSKAFTHTSKTLFRVSSIEVVAKRESLQKARLSFDTNFGLGSGLPASEENIFLLDCFKSKLNIKYFPEFINCHPSESTGKNWSNKAMRSSKLPFMYRCFGCPSYLIFILFAIKKYPEYRKDIGFFKMISENIKSLKKYIEVR